MNVFKYTCFQLLAIDGSTVLTFLPPAQDPATLSFIRDSEWWVRKK